jgi:hypothetical protein
VCAPVAWLDAVVSAVPVSVFSPPSAPLDSITVAGADPRSLHNLRALDRVSLAISGALAPAFPGFNPIRYGQAPFSPSPLRFSRLRCVSPDPAPFLPTLFGQLLQSSRQGVIEELPRCLFHYLTDESTVRLRLRMYR